MVPGVWTQTLNPASREVDEELAAEIREFRSPTDGETRMFYEIVIAPSYTEAGLAKLRGKSKTLRILEAPPRAPSGRSLRQVGGEAEAPVCLVSPLQVRCKSANVHQQADACLLPVRVSASRWSKP